MAHKILIVDDEPNIVLSLEYLMRKEGYEVEVAVDGEAAIDAANRFCPQLVLLDVMMPKKSGYEVCENLRTNAAHDGLKIIMLTAKGRAADAAKGVALGADAYMTKPFSTKELVALVKKLLADEHTSPGAAA